MDRNISDLLDKNLGQSGPIRQDDHSGSLRRLRALLDEMLRLNAADLDFGVFRITQLKRTEVESFLNNQLTAEVDKAFEALSSSERDTLQKQIVVLSEEVRKAVAPEAILNNGEPNPDYAKVIAVKNYAAVRRKLQNIEVSEAQRAEAFNLLYAFFSRYYDQGDFVPNRYFSSRPVYSIPSSGEEVLFHWANWNQYYVKSGEALRDYTFSVSTLAGAYRVRFKLVQATTPKDNVKGDTRFFFVRYEDTNYDEQTKTLVLPFEYRLPTEAETERYGRNSKAQEAVINEATPKILKSVPVEALRFALGAPFDERSEFGRESERKNPQTLINKRLTDFTRRQTTDYFVNKDLGTFLRQEMEFFVRDQVIHELDLEGDIQAKGRTLRVFRGIAETIIEFLSQIEDAQRSLFEKKKFVLETSYLVAIQYVPRSLWKDVLTNKKQINEWKDELALQPRQNLLNLEGSMNDHVLEQNPTLVVDTRHFPAGFTAQLLESIKDVDDWTDGLLIKGENFQALSLLQARYKGQVKCIHIDPPYNTETSGFLYKNNYRHSSWLAMMENRLSLAKMLLTTDGHLLCHIDENEYERLKLLLDKISLPDAGTIVWDKRNPMTASRGVAIQHEYVVWRSNTEEPIYQRNTNIVEMIDTAKDIVKRHGGVTEEARQEYSKWVRRNPRLSGGEKAYSYLDDKGQIFRGVSLRAPEPRTDPKFFVPLIHPVTHKPCPVPPNGFSRTPETLQTMLKNGEILFGRDETTQPEQKRLLTEDTRLQVRSVIQDAKKGKEYLDELGLNFPYCHPVSLYEELVSAAASSTGDVVIDFFAGSGTTAHAVINLNRSDGKRRRFIMVEMADYFDTVLVPRIKKIMFTPEWKNAKPERPATKEEAMLSPRLVKVLRLESYEDALHNSFSAKNLGQTAKQESAYRKMVGDPDFSVRYMIKLPLNASASMLNLVNIEHPGEYTLETLTENGPIREEVDLVETFNWIYGLKVYKVLSWTNEKDSTRVGKGRTYRVVVASDSNDKKRVLVVWRDMTELDPATERQFLEATVEKLGPFEEKWINGDSASMGFKSLDSTFKRLMVGN